MIFLLGRVFGAPNEIMLYLIYCDVGLVGPMLNFQYGISL